MFPASTHYNFEGIKKVLCKCLVRTYKHTLMGCIDKGLPTNSLIFLWQNATILKRDQQIHKNVIATKATNI